MNIYCHRELVKYNYFPFTANQTKVHEWRLVEGLAESEGRLEFRFIDGKWRPVCSKCILDFIMATRFCKELGYDSVMWYTYEASIFGVNNGPIFIVNTDQFCYDSPELCSSENIVSLRCLTGRKSINQSLNQSINQSINQSKCYFRRTKLTTSICVRNTIMLEKSPIGL